MGHKHTHLLAAAFTTLAAVQFLMVLSLQTQVQALADAANLTASVVSRPMHRAAPADATPQDRGQRRADATGAMVRGGIKVTPAMTRGQNRTIENQ